MRAGAASCLVSPASVRVDASQRCASPHQHHVSPIRRRVNMSLCSAFLSFLLQNLVK
jgi:hypothetical protein